LMPFCDFTIREFITDNIPKNYHLLNKYSKKNHLLYNFNHNFLKKLHSFKFFIIIAF